MFETPLGNPFSMESDSVYMKLCISRITMINNRIT